MMTSQRTARGLGCLLLLLLLGGAGFFAYTKTQEGTTLTLQNNATLVIERCSGSIQIYANTSANQVKVENSLFVSSTYASARNALILQSCNSRISVPQNTNLSINASRIDVIGVTGKMEIETNGGMITVLRSTLLDGTKLETNGGIISFNGKIPRNGKIVFDNNGGLVDITLPRNSSFELDAGSGLSAVATNFPGLHTFDNDTLGREHLGGTVGPAPRVKLVLDINGTNVVLKGV